MVAGAPPAGRCALGGLGSDGAAAVLGADRTASPAGATVVARLRRVHQRHDEHDRDQDAGDHTHRG